MINTLKIYDVLVAAEIDPMRARVITDAIVRLLESKAEVPEVVVAEGQSATLETRSERRPRNLLKWGLLMILAQAAVLFAGVYVMLA